MHEGNSDLTGRANVKVVDLDAFPVGEQHIFLIAVKSDMLIC